MKERQILFSAPMVQALLAGTKTQTRRVVKPQPPDWVTCYNERLMDTHFWCEHDRDDDSMRHWPSYEHGLRCPYGQPGDRLWVRETWQETNAPDQDGRTLVYRADYPDVTARECFGPWTPSIYMPRRASRITLEVTDVRVERLQEISERDAFAEGINGEKLFRAQGYAPLAYQRIWEQINGAGSWEANPWVWVIGFRRC